MLIGYDDMRALAVHLGVYAEDETILEGRAGVVEHLVHEVAHALSLDLPVRPGLEDAIGNALVNHRGSLDSASYENEALVLASEAYTLPRLGIHFRDARGALRDAGESQGVPSEVFADAWASEEAQRLGVRVLRYLARKSGCGRRGLQGRVERDGRRQLTTMLRRF